MRDEQLFLTPDGPERPRILVRDAADIKRLRIHLLTHWTQPGVVFCVEDLPALESQRAQDRFVRIYDGCNCLIGELLGATVLVGGSFMAWTSAHSYRDIGLVLVAAAYATLLGKGIELVWMRMKLLRVLRRLRRRLAGMDFDEVAPVPAAVKPFRVETDAVVQDSRIERPALPHGPRPARVLLRDATDINRLIPRLAIHWVLPRIEIRMDTLPQVEVQRAQVRIARLSSNFSYLPAALLAIAIFLGGMLFAVWTESDGWMNMQSEEWRYAQENAWWLSKVKWGGVVIATLGAGLTGAAIEMAWRRVRLLLVLRGLRQQLPPAA